MVVSYLTASIASSFLECIRPARLTPGRGGERFSRSISRLHISLSKLELRSFCSFHAPFRRVLCDARSFGLTMTIGQDAETLCNSRC